MLILPANLVWAAKEADPPKIKHESPETYIPGFRIELDATIADKAGIQEARCYFKARNDDDFIFVDMVKYGESEYESILPAPALLSQAVNYYFLVVTSDKRVAKSQVFEIREQDTGEAKELKQAQDSGKKGLDEMKDRLEKKVREELKNRLKKHQTAKRDGTINAKTDQSSAPKKSPNFSDSVDVKTVKPELRYSMKKDGVTQVTATGGGVGLGWIIGGLAVAGGAAAAAGGGGGGGSSSGGTTPPPATGGTQLGATVTTPNGSGSQISPFFIQLNNFASVSVPVTVEYDGASAGTYAGTGTGDFPISYRAGATGRLILQQNVSGGSVELHFRTNGGRRSVSVTGNSGDYIRFQTL